MGDRARLGEPVTLHDHGGDPLGHLLGKLGAERRGPGHDHVERREVVLVDARVLGEGEGHRRHDVGSGHAMALEQVEELLEVEPGHRHDRRSGPEALVHDHRHPVDVEERQAADQDVVGTDRERRLELA